MPRPRAMSLHGLDGRVQWRRARTADAVPVDCLAPRDRSAPPRGLWPEHSSLPAPWRRGALYWIFGRVAGYFGTHIVITQFWSGDSL